MPTRLTARSVMVVDLYSMKGPLMHKKVPDAAMKKMNVLVAGYSVSSIQSIVLNIDHREVGYAG